MTGLPGGLSEVIARQLERQMGAGAAAPIPAARRPRVPAATGAPSAGAHPATRAPGRLRAAAHRSAAQAAEARDRHPGRVHGRPGGARDAAGASARSATPTAAPSHNLFGIKAGAGWKGAVAEVTTTEVRRRPGREGDGEVPRLRSLRRVVRRLRAADEGQPALPARCWRSGRHAERLRRRACSAPATPPTRPTPTS